MFYSDEKNQILKKNIDIFNVAMKEIINQAQNYTFGQLYSLHILKHICTSVVFAKVILIISLNIVTLFISSLNYSNQNLISFYTIR